MQIGRLLLFGAALSLLVHLSVLIWLATMYRMQSDPPPPTPVFFDFTLLPESDLLDAANADFSELAPEIGDALDQAVMPEDLAADIDASLAAQIDLGSSAPSTIVGAGGATGAEGFGAGAGAGGSASFFGLSARGNRFAYIVDVSGSMAIGDRMSVMIDELCTSIERLPDTANFYIVFFSSAYSTPPIQRGWQLARAESKRRMTDWIRAHVHPGGGTVPGPAFEHVFGLSVRPDAIFFLTDGEIPSDTADGVAGLNTGRRRVVVHTIAFGEATSQDELRRIARESGGTYRYVPTTE